MDGVVGSGKDTFLCNGGVGEREGGRKASDSEATITAHKRERRLPKRRASSKVTIKQEERAYFIGSYYSIEFFILCSCLLYK